MNVYELSLGFTKHFVAANDEQHAYTQGTDPERFPDIHFLPFTITKVEIPGHTINVTADEPTAAEETNEEDPHDSEDLPPDRDGLKAWLKERNIEFTPQWGEDKLRELALQHV